jgi:2-amino-4-hydroxy-6-hydroxymethyldihydropteridine diphosphokinase
MTEIYVGAGSNIEPERNLLGALTGLADTFGLLHLSPDYRNQAVGFDGDDFLNMVVGFETDMDLGAVLTELERIEKENGRTREGTRFGPRSLDLDLLLFGDRVDEGENPRVPRKEITRYAFVLKPLADLCADRCHPVTGVSFGQLWDEFDQSKHPLESIEMNWVCE